MPDCSLDAIVTDPPYELGFMGKKWDATGIAYDVDLWRECLRVLKPGGHLLAFGGTRTYHRMTSAIEDAGFEIRDSIHWLYGSGFPKSHDVSKAIDKTNGEPNRLHKFTAWMRTTGVTARQLDEILRNAGAISPTSSHSVHYFNDGQPAIPTAAMWILIRPHCGDVPKWVDELVQRIAAEREVVGKHSAPAKSIYTQAAVSLSRDVDITAPATDAAREWEGWGTALKPAHEPIVMARKPLIGTVAANVQTHGTGALNIDRARVGRVSGDVSIAGKRTATFGTQETQSGGDGSGGWKQNDEGRWPANVITDGSIKAEWVRYFYCAKPSKAERNAGLDALPKIKGGSMVAAETRPGKPTNHPIRQNFHPTVKPLALMRYLVRLVTPPGGTVLEPFAGSGTTLVAAILEGFNAIGCELTEDYLPIINGRIHWAHEQRANKPESLFPE